MKRLCKILIFTIIPILSLSCASEGIYDNLDSGASFMTGKVTDMKGNPIEHIMVTIDWGAAAGTPDIEYTDSDFSQAIEEQFFSGDRLVQFRFMNVERQALWILWDAEEIKFVGLDD